MNRRVVTCDLDSTLCDTEQRFHLINRQGQTDWDAYSKACVDDALVESVATLVKMLMAMYDVWFISGRSDVAKFETEKWLLLNEVPYSGLMLGPWISEETEGGMSHGDFKVMQIREVERITGKPVVLHIDDHPVIPDVLKKAGYQCLTVTPPFQIKKLAVDYGAA